ncbi:MAG: hypothetical protein HY553_18855 [Elusimicrobia bacterium]|nr:hypothetical protein [Elusimicrobiota bacterium]
MNRESDSRLPTLNPRPARRERRSPVTAGGQPQGLRGSLIALLTILLLVSCGVDRLAERRIEQAERAARTARLAFAFDRASAQMRSAARVTPDSSLEIGRQDRTDFVQPGLLRDSVGSLRAEQPAPAPAAASARVEPTDEPSASAASPPSSSPPKPASAAPAAAGDPAALLSSALAGRLAPPALPEAGPAKRTAELPAARLTPLGAGSSAGFAGGLSRGFSPVRLTNALPEGASRSSGQAGLATPAGTLSGLADSLPPVLGRSRPRRASVPDWQSRRRITAPARLAATAGRLRQMSAVLGANRQGGEDSSAAHTAEWSSARAGMPVGGAGASDGPALIGDPPSKAPPLSAPAARGGPIHAGQPPEPGARAERPFDPGIPPVAGEVNVTPYQSLIDLAQLLMRLASALLLAAGLCYLAAKSGILAPVLLPLASILAVAAAAVAAALAVIGLAIAFFGQALQGLLYTAIGALIFLASVKVMNDANAGAAAEQGSEKLAGETSKAAESHLEMKGEPSASPSDGGGAGRPIWPEASPAGTPSGDGARGGESGEGEAAAAPEAPWLRNGKLR